MYVSHIKRKSKTIYLSELFDDRPRNACNSIDTSSDIYWQQLIKVKEIELPNLAETSKTC